MYCELRGDQDSQIMNVYFDNEDMYDAFTKKNKTGDDVVSKRQKTGVME